MATLDCVLLLVFFTQMLPIFVSLQYIHHEYQINMKGPVLFFLLFALSICNLASSLDVAPQVRLDDEKGYYEDPIKDEGTKKKTKLRHLMSSMSSRRYGSYYYYPSTPTTTTTTASLYYGSGYYPGYSYGGGSYQSGYFGPGFYPGFYGGGGFQGGYYGGGGGYPHGGYYPGGNYGGYYGQYYGGYGYGGGYYGGQPSQYPSYPYYYGGQGYQVEYPYYYQTPTHAYPVHSGSSMMSRRLRGMKNLD